MAQDQIKEINQKLDLLLEHVNQQRLRSEMAEDLISDVALIGKDAYDSTVTQLEDQGVDLDGEALQQLLFKLLKNAHNFSMILTMVESMGDLMKDLGPVAIEAGHDVIEKFHQFEQKGYFEFLKESSKIMDNIVAHYSVEDIRMLADNIVTILDTVKNLTQPDMLRAMNNAFNIFKDLDPTSVPEYSIWKLVREMNSREMKRGIGFIITFMKNLTPVQKEPPKTNK